MQRLARLVGQCQQLLGVGEKGLALLGQPHTLAFAEEQAGAELFLQLLDARGDVRLGALQALCGAGHALLEGHGAEEGEVGEIHGLL